MNREQIAQVAHEVNRAYLLSTGADAPGDWEQTGELYRAAWNAAVAKVLKDLPEVTPAPSGFVAVRYIGPRAIYVDGAYGTKIQFNQGESKLVPADKAALMLTHKDVYELGQAPAGAEPPAAEIAKKDDSDPSQDMRDAVANMTKASLVTHAKVHYGMDLDPAMKKDDMRAKVIGLIDQYGIE